MNPRLFLFILLILGVEPGFTQSFVHPGIDQRKVDLEYMKKQVLAGAQPWKSTFERVKLASDRDFKVKPFVHVLRGASGRPNIGGSELSGSADMAYNCALMWYITGEQRYAEKAKDILNAWSDTLWGFDYNDAKLIAGWTGHQLCNAAELLKHTGAGWQKNDIARFTRMLMTVYYPVIRNYYPQANGNWDGAIIQTIMAIGIFTDNRELFNNAVEHFLYAPLNGSLFKYIYPSGQCQESTRDQGHVQFGQGQFSGAARVAYSQGLDFFSIADHRIARGYEYTSGFLLGRKTQAYGTISEARKDVNGDYEYVYRHYSSKGIDMPYTKILADSVRSRAGRGVLTAFRAPEKDFSVKLSSLKQSSIGYPAGALDHPQTKAPAGSVTVIPGASLQRALDSLAGTGKWVVAAAGVHIISKTLNIPSGITLAGMGQSTIIFLDPESKDRDAITNANVNLNEVTIRDLVIEGSLSYKPLANSARSFNNIGRRGGIVFVADREGSMKDINLVQLTVRNCVYSGVAITAATGITVSSCDFSENGARMVPGQHLLHNLKLSHCADVQVRDSRFDTSPDGSGIAIDKCTSVSVSNCEIARNGYYGIKLNESKDVRIQGNLVEANDRSGILMEFLFQGNANVKMESNIVRYNNGVGIESYVTQELQLSDNNFQGNRSGPKKISKNEVILLE